MQIGVLGTGVVGRTIGGALVRAGHRVRMGSRAAGNPHAVEWARSVGAHASEGTFADAARPGALLFNCTAGAVSLQALEQAGADNLRGKVLVDVANPLDFSQGMPPTLTVCNTDSLGEQIQRAFPETRVVKALSTINCDVMVNPRLLEGSHQSYLCGNSEDAKEEVRELLVRAFGWERQNLMDIGDISASRGLEMLIPHWVRLMVLLRTPHFNFTIAGAARDPQIVAAPAAPVQS